MKNRATKRLLSWLMSAVMVVSEFGGMPLAVNAYEDTQEEAVVEAAEDVTEDVAVIEDETAAASALAGYKTALTTALFTELGEDDDGDMHYGSPDSEYSLCPYVYSNMVVIDITQPGPSTWPGTEIAALLASYGFTDAIPVMSGADEYNISDYYGYPQIYVYFSNASDAEAACSAYQSALLTAGFTDAGDYYGDPKYASPNQQFEISPWIGSSGTTVIIDIAEQLG